MLPVRVSPSWKRAILVRLLYYAASELSHSPMAMAHGEEGWAMGDGLTRLTGSALLPLLSQKGQNRQRARLHLGQVYFSKIFKILRHIECLT
jgi:hypothetical protein